MEGHGAISAPSRPKLRLQARPRKAPVRPSPGQVSDGSGRACSMIGSTGASDGESSQICLAPESFAPMESTVYALGWGLALTRKTMKSFTYIDGTWHEGNPPILGPMSHATWLSSIIFDGARAFEGVSPDLDRHCERAINSARTMGLRPMLSAGEIEELARDGIRKHDKSAELYIRPMFFAESGWIYPDPDSTRFTLSVYESPMPKPTDGCSIGLSPYRRPAPDQATTDAKASCLYPNSGRALREAEKRGFDNCVVLDPLGFVAELATANIMMAKNGVVHTPAANGTFLAGITRRRVIQLL